MELWYKRRKERLALEEKSFQGKQLELSLNKKLLESKHIVVFEGKIQAVDGEHELQVVYPPFFPDKPPTVIDKTKIYKRHQNPRIGNLCLPVWHRKMTGADKVLEAITYINRYIQDPDSLKDDEADAGEPLSMYYEYSFASSVIITPPFTKEPNEQRGFFKIGRLPFLHFDSAVHPMQTALTYYSETVKDQENIIATVKEGLLKGNGIEFMGPWLWSAEPPPHSIDSFDELKHWMIGRDKDIAHRVNRSCNLMEKDYKKKNLNIRCECIGVVYPDESPIKGQFYAQWLIGLLIKQDGKQSSYLLRPMHLPTDDEYYTRMSFLKGTKNKRVAIIGLGAIGSHLALELARAGIKSFLLVDPDWYLPDVMVRQATNLSNAGMLKVLAIREQIFLVHPSAIVDILPLRIGEAPQVHEKMRAAQEDLQNIIDMLSKCDLIISATGDTDAEYTINEILREIGKPGIFASSTNGAWGGHVFRSMPGQACFQCFIHYYGDSAIYTASSAPEKTEVYARGCGNPAFSGAGFDSSIISNLAARLAVQTLLLRDGDKSYPEANYNLINWSSRGSDAGDNPRIDTKQIDVHPDCSICKQKTS